MTKLARCVLGISSLFIGMGGVGRDSVGVSAEIADTTSITGNIVDVAGQPAANARVVVINQFHGGIRMYESVAETETDAQGNYRVDGLKRGAHQISHVVVAAVLGDGPPAFARARFVGLQRTDLKDLEPHEQVARWRADLVVARHGATITVRVLDDGKPAIRGDVHLSLNDWASQMGLEPAWPDSADGRLIRDRLWHFTRSLKEGDIARFEQLPPGEYTVRVLNGNEYNSAARRGDAYRPVREYTGYFAVMGKDTDATLQLAPLNRKIRVHFIKPDGTNIDPRNVFIGHHRKRDLSSFSALARRNAETKEGSTFSFERHGATRLAVTASDTRSKVYPISEPNYEADVRIATTSLYPRIVERTVHLTRVEPFRHRNLTLGASFSISQGTGVPVSGTALMPGGAVPAAGMRLFQFVEETSTPVSGAWADASGRFTTVPLQVPSYTIGADAPGSPKGTFLMAWVPGATAKAIVPVAAGKDREDDLKLVLPHGHRVRGQVTVAGNPALPIAAGITLLFQHQGFGKIDPYLSQVVTAEADGRFDVASLTPGRYVCQAALENLWISPAAELDLFQDTLDLKFDIPAPGAPAPVRFLLRAGLPLRQQQIEVDWLPGPLTTRLHSDPLFTDAEGWVTFDGCSRGTARVRIHGGKNWHEITVADISDANPASRTITLVTVP